MCADRKMTELNEAIELILSNIKSLEDVEVVPLIHAHGRVLAKAITSGMNVPSFNNSAMDGYTLRSAELTAADVQQKSFSVSQRIPAGSQGVTLQAGTVARIFTGAPIPDGADTVIQQEHAAIQEDGSVVFTHLHPQGDNVRLAGEDIERNATVIPVGKKLSIADIGLVASVGVAEFEVYRRPKVALFVTGDELTAPGEALKPGGIYNSNQFVLRELLLQLGCELSDKGIVRDSLQAVEDHLEEAAKTHDLILTSGGVSVGEEDHVKHAVEKLGELKLWKLAFKPGKPLAFGQLNKVKGSKENGAWFLGLPGNPVASYVTFLMVVRPFLQKLGGQTVKPVKAMQLKANFEGQSKGRREFWRARINEEGNVDIYPNQGSGVLTSMAWGEGFIDLPARTQVNHGDVINYIPFANFMS